LILGVAALIAAGVFSILLVLARTPILQGLIPGHDLFRIALVVHVDLSVLVWFLSFAALYWTWISKHDDTHWYRLSFLLALLGTLGIVLAPLAGASDPLMNNYVPVLQHLWFYIALGLFCLGITGAMLRALRQFPTITSSINGQEALTLGIILAAITGIVTIGSFITSWLTIPSGLSGQIYFDVLFWGPGHVLQFGHTGLMLVSWLLLLYTSGGVNTVSPRLAVVLLVMVTLPIITVPFFHLAHDIVSPGYRLAFTELMKNGGLATVPLGLAILWGLFSAPKPEPDQRHLRAAIHCSILLFAVGGLLGFAIQGLDISIPAHYHGSIVGVTLAFMGVAYLLLPRLGYRPPDAKFARWQLWIYAIGQLTHIFGLAWTGGYGVGRKTAGAAQGLSGFGEITGMALMGFGGLISVTGGFLFLVIMIRSMWLGREN
jgi:cytochrome c oxidase subunit 1